MKKILMILSLVAISEMALAQHEAGDKNLNVGLGLGSTFASGSTTIPPLGASFEIGIKDEISVGGYLGYSASELKSGGFTAKYSYTIIGVRGSYHYDLLGDPKIDTYGGLMLGYNVAGVDWDGPGNAASAGGVSYSLYVGGRYAFSDKVGAFAELGYGIAYLQLGANVKF
ncbi:MAG: outer membrane beta-barrel protein [Cyclobacteriaceae bacterium]